jgi:hypothetical protein
MQQIEGSVPLQSQRYPLVLDIRYLRKLMMRYQNFLERRVSPGFAMLWSQLILKEPITQSMIIGCSFILLGTATANDLLTKLFNQNENI